MDLFTQGKVMAGRLWGGQAQLAAPSPAVVDRLQATQTTPLALYSARRTSYKGAEVAGEAQPPPHQHWHTIIDR